MLGFSFSEVILIGIVALVAVGPQRLPGMLKNFGGWMRKLRKLTTEVRAQTGIDDILRAEGIQGGITELRSLMRGGAPAPVAPYRPYDDPYRQVEVDLSREYPPEGPDAKGALPDDLTGEDDEDDAPVVTVVADHTPPEPAPEPSAAAADVAAPADAASAALDAPAPTGDAAAEATPPVDAPAPDSPAPAGAAAPEAAPPAEATAPTDAAAPSVAEPAPAPAPPGDKPTPEAQP